MFKRTGLFILTLKPDICAFKSTTLLGHTILGHSPFVLRTVSGLAMCTAEGGAGYPGWYGLRCGAWAPCCAAEADADDDEDSWPTRVTKSEKWSCWPGCPEAAAAAPGCPFSAPAP